MNPLLTVTDLHVRFAKSLHAVRGISFSLHAGETLGIVGESGCGKSATAKALVKLSQAELSGEVRLHEENLLTFSEKKMRKIRGKEIGMIFQDPMTSLNPTLTIGSQIAEGIERHFPGTSRKNALESALKMLRRVGIPYPEERLDAYPHTLSGGMRQRVMIAIALACNPKILIADEPTTALDVTIQAQILDLMQEIQKEMGTSILLITHDLSVVAKMCDRVLVMYAGQIVESAPVEALFHAPKHPYTKALLQATARLSRSKENPLIPIEGTPPHLAVEPKGCAFCPRCVHAMHICAKESPILYNPESNHYSRCFQHDLRKGP
ncbi:MAG: ABC transporter ATP-binding protein [Verrucomicrobia bacterium]|nr:ABC transporter ATP-binding protein [Verrucomicrobiota bacterium]